MPAIGPHQIMQLKNLYKNYRHWRRVALNVWQASRAKKRYGYPEKSLRLIGVTGTDGKTTTSTMLAAILKQSGRKVGLISTVGAKINDAEIDTGLHVSTPGPTQIYELLAKMKSKGVEDVVIETTSHGLDQRRLFGLSFEIGIITNISAEHLDYHGTMQKYAAAKALLLKQSSLAILNADDEVVSKMNQFGIPQLMFSTQKSADVMAINLQAKAEGTQFKLRYLNQDPIEVLVGLPGEYNVSNALAASAAALTLGASREAIAASLSHVVVAGRWQVLQVSPFTVIVDFAHTPQAFKASLSTAQGLLKGDSRIIHVFGSAAQRDEDKRSQMGFISGTYASLTILTMEDPRYESLDRIQGMLADGLKEAGKEEGKSYWRIDDRQDAINRAIDLARPGDVVIVTGKGHEQSLSIKGKEMPWSDVAAVKKALSRNGDKS